MTRMPCCGKVGLKKGPWTPEEDKKLIKYVTQHGHGNWRSLPARAGLERCGKSCRLRWINYLKPDIKRGNFSIEEERTIIHLHALLGNKWSTIAANLPNRTDNEIKNYWNSNIKKRLIKMGIDPITHKPNNNKHTIEGDNGISHMAQWESVRLEAEARSSMLQQHIGSTSMSTTTTTRPARLIISNIVHPNNLLSSSTKQNYYYNMCAIMLANNDDYLESPVSTLSFPNNNNIVGGGGGSISINGGVDSMNMNNIIEKTHEITTNGHDTLDIDYHEVSNCMQDDDIMVAVEAFIASSRK